MQEIEQSAMRARDASNRLVALSTEVKNRVLRDVADGILSDGEVLQRANEQDLSAARQAGLADSKVRRLALSPVAVTQMADGLRQVAELDDPVGEVVRHYTVPSGLQVKRVRCPIGVIMMIYEARPNVTIDAFGLCFKAGNACILKGGREAMQTNRALAEVVSAVLQQHHISRHAITLITSSDRQRIKALLALNQFIDLVIPRGGVELIRFVHEHARMPMVQHFQGVCHIFVDESADQDAAVDICATAKSGAPAACNAVETILVHAAIAESFIPRLACRLGTEGVEIHGDSGVCRLVPQAVAATDEDWSCEYLDLIVALRIVPDIDAALAHIKRYSTNHTEAILSSDPVNQRRFTENVHSSCVLVNASTRFNDGFQLGLGAEIGISTSRIHAYGPMGLEELTTQRYVVSGDGHYR